MSSCRAQVQPRGLKPKTEASSTTATSLDRSPDSRADCCPVSLGATNTNHSAEQKTKTSKTKTSQNLLDFPRVWFLWKARRLISCQISHPSYRSFHIGSLWDQRELCCNSIQVDCQIIVVLSLSRYLFPAHFTQSPVLFVYLGNVRIQMVFHRFADNLGARRSWSMETGDA